VSANAVNAMSVLPSPGVASARNSANDWNVVSTGMSCPALVSGAGGEGRRA